MPEPLEVLEADLYRCRASDRLEWLERTDEVERVYGRDAHLLRKILGGFLAVIGLPLGFFGGGIPVMLLTAAIIELTGESLLSFLLALPVFFGGSLLIAFPGAILVPVILYVLVVEPRAVPVVVRRLGRQAFRKFPVRRRARPPAGEVITAIEAMEGEAWEALARAIARVRSRDVPTDLTLASERWRDQILAFAGLEGRGDEVAHRLVPLARENEPWRSRSARRLLEGIRARTELPGGDVGDLVCTACRARVAEVELEGDARYVACRSCHRTSSLVACPEGFEARVDPGRRVDGDALDPVRLEDGRLILDWLRTREPADFDRIRIGPGSSDGDVEELCIDAGNDPDPVRRERYGRIPVQLDPGVQLAPNTREMLRRTFGEIVTG